MTATKGTASVLALLYLAFFSWYTSCAGPLTPEEVEHYLALMAENRPDRADPETLAMLRAFLESDTGDDFVMWNVADLHETPLPIEGVEPGQSSGEVVGRYMEYMLPALLKRACHPVLFGSSAGQAIEMFGLEGAREWDQGAAMRYRSRRDLMEIVSAPGFDDAHPFKVAGMKKTFAFPVDPWMQLGDPRLVLALLFLVVGLAVAAASNVGGRR